MQRTLANFTRYQARRVPSALSVARSIDFSICLARFSGRVALVIASI
jgi:hypothetical protein